MKRLFTLLFLFALTGCAGQVKPEPPTMVEANFDIMQLTEQAATLSSKEVAFVYEIDAIKDLEKSKAYFFILEVAPGQTGKIRSATVLFYHISPDQARRNINEALLLHKRINGPPK